MNESSKVNDVVDTTDCLEAIVACKGMKNLSFVIVLICLLLLQGVFWLSATGYINSAEEGVVVVESVSAEIVEPVAQEVVEKQVEEAAPVVEKIVSPEETQADKVVGEITGEIAGGQDDTAEPEAEVVASEDSFKENISKYLVPNHDHAVLIVRVCNFALIFAASLYSLVLLISLKISLVGRLGGISHISRGFFLSLITLVILMPWQVMFEGVCLGAIYTPAELFGDWSTVSSSALGCKILYYLRFAGMEIVVLLLVLSAQCRSAKWAKTTLRRLGVVR